MIRTQQVHRKPVTAIDKREIARIISAAVINTRFRDNLLTDPLKAVSEGFYGETFALPKEQQDRLATISAKSLAEFAAQFA